MSLRSSTSRPARPSGSSARVRQGDGPVEIPEYQPLEFPLTTKAQGDAQALALATAPFKSIVRNIAPAITAVSNSAADINERLTQITDQQRSRREKRARLKLEDDEAEQGRGKQLERRTEEVKKLTTDLEAHVRQLIDCDVLMTAREVALKESANTAIEQSRAADGEQGRVKAEVTSQTQLLAEQLRTKSEEWDGKTKMEKYSQNKAYVAFKQYVHDAQFPEDNVPPLPKPRTWFPEENDVAMDTDSDGSDIEMASESRSLKCPLTLKIFENPVKSKKCPHVFERSAIEDLIRHGDQRLNATKFDRHGEPTNGIMAMRCPQPGCQVILCQADLEPDLITARKIKRLAESQRQTQAASDDEDGAGPPGTQGNRPASIDEDSGDDIDDFEESQIMQVKRERMQARASRGDTMDIDGEDSD